MLSDGGFAGSIVSCASRCLGDECSSGYSWSRVFAVLEQLALQLARKATADSHWSSYVYGMGGETFDGDV